MNEPHVILVNKNDKPIGTMPKMEAHKKGVLHRAISIFLFDLNGNFLLQKRASNKYHSPNLWSNTCCSHPLPEENTLDAASRRLTEEMGMKCELNFAFTFLYKAILENDLTEYELDHVFVGFTNLQPQINTQEVANWCYLPYDLLNEHVNQHPEKYTEWFKLLYNKVHLFLHSQTTFKQMI
jgi:isopentenyl-diphosphate delta-isomerase